MNLGGKCNSKLKSTHGKGWVFPKTKQEKVEIFLKSKTDEFTSSERWSDSSERQPDRKSHHEAFLFQGWIWRDN